MRCDHCRAEYREEDIYCPRCGEELQPTSTSLVPVERSLPTRLYQPQLPRKVAASVGAVALGFGLEVLRRSMITRLSRPSRAVEAGLPMVQSLKDILLPGNEKKAIRRRKKGYEVEETVVYMRRVTRN